MSALTPSFVTLIPEIDKILHTTAVPVGVFDEALADLARKMVNVMNQEHGIGLAAPQVGHSVRLIVLLDLESRQPQVWVNPHIVSSAGWQWNTEGCLSLPGKSVRKMRAADVVVQAQDLNGVPHTFARSGLAAACVQHEIDHLNGVLMTDVP